MAAVGTITVHVTELPQVKALVQAAVAVVKARNAGADCYEAKAEIDSLESALTDLAAFTEEEPPA